MTSDDMPKLGPERVELVRRIFPVADIRPMDLYPLAGKPRIFDLRIASPGAGQWDVVAVFNWDALQSVSVRLEPKDLGWPDGRFLYYDVWQKKLLGTGPGGLTLALAPGSCQVLAVRPAADHPQLVGTSRHLTQGADDLLEAAWDPARATWKGQSRVVGGDAYELRFTLPPGWTSTDARAKIDGPLAVLTLKSDVNRSVAWSLAFAKSSAAPAAAPGVRGAKATADGPSVAVAWQGEGAWAYRVYRNGELVDQTAECRFIERLRHPGTYRYEVSAVGWQGESARVAAGQVVRRPLPKGTSPRRLARYADAGQPRSGLRLAPAIAERRRPSAADRRQDLCPRPGHPRQQPDPLRA